jgi:hypothetical protein
MQIQAYQEVSVTTNDTHLARVLLRHISVTAYSLRNARAALAPREDVHERYIPTLGSRPAYPWLLDEGLAGRFHAAPLASPEYVGGTLAFL